MRTRYMLRSRFDDNSEWSQPEEFTTRRARNAAASMARVFGGIRTHSYEEKFDSGTVVDAKPSDATRRSEAQESNSQFGGKLGVRGETA